jgi:uncharacterized membrane protein
VNWTVAATAFGGALVEFVEAALIVLAAAAAGGWRTALAGTVAAVGILAVVTAALGAALLQLVPLAVLRGVVGALLLLFGVKWLAKAALRLGSPPRTDVPSVHEPEHGRGEAFTASFNGVLLEGAEVVFIVLALGGTGRAMGSAVGGAAAAAALCILGAVAARRPLAAVPEVALKFAVGVMLTSFGTFWLGEALGVPWWGSDAAIAWLALADLGLGLALVQVLRRGAGLAPVAAGGPQAQARGARQPQGARHPGRSRGGHRTGRGAPTRAGRGRR